MSLALQEEERRQQLRPPGISPTKRVPVDLTEHIKKMYNLSPCSREECLSFKREKEERERREKEECE